jgi:hypothetical protein
LPGQVGPTKALSFAYSDCLQYEQAITLDLNLTPECFLFSHTIFLCNFSVISIFRNFSNYMKI